MKQKQVEANQLLHQHHLQHLHQKRKTNNMSRPAKTGVFDDWNSLYENEWPAPLNTYSTKWHWQYADKPYVKYVSVTNLPYRIEEEYMSSSPYRVSNMYKALHKNEFSGYVNALSDL